MDLLNSLLDTPIYIVGSLLIWGLVAYILIQLLVQFEIIPRHNQPAREVWGRLARVYEPMLRPFRQILPVLGGFDLSPLVLVFAIYIVRYALIWAL